MKKICSLLLMAVSLMLVSSCGNSSKDIEILISNREYDKAREIAIEKFYEREQSLKLYQITKAQMEELFLDGDYKEAYEIAREAKQPYAFQDVFAENVNAVLAKGNYDFIFKVLGEWKIYYEYNEQLRDLLKNEDFILREYAREGDYMEKDPLMTSYNRNGPYNADVRRLNTCIDKVLESCIEEKDASNIKECLKLYKPYAAIDNKKDTGEKCGDAGNFYLFTFKLVNTAKEEAQKKVTAAGIEL